MSGCPHGFPKPSNCVDCMDEGNLPVPPKPKPVVLASGRAKFGSGQCPGCNLPIRVHEPIALVAPSHDAEHGVWHHYACVPGEAS